MDIIHNNPFRIAGVYANASTKEIQKNKTKITRFAEVGREVDFETDFSILRKVNRNLSSATKAFAQLQQGNDKLKHSLFWFVNFGTHDGPALDHLRNGNKEKAHEIWTKVTDGKNITSRSYSYFNNLGTLKLLSKSLTEIQEGIGLKVQLLESASFKSFVNLVAGETIAVDAEKERKSLIDLILDQYKDTYSGSDAMKLFVKCNGSTHVYLSNKMSAEHILSIENKITATKRKRKEEKGNADGFGTKLFFDTESELTALKELLTVSNLQYKTIADNLAKEILQCGVDYFQHWKEIKDPSKESLRVIELASSIAVGSTVTDRIKDNQEAIQEWAKTAPVRDQLEFITQALSEFRYKTDSPSNAKYLLDSCQYKLKVMSSILGSSNDLYLNISTAVVTNVQNMIIAAVNDEQLVVQAAIDLHSVDQEALAQVMLKRANGNSSKANREFERLLEQSRFTAIENYKSVLREAMEISRQVGTLDMKQDARTWYTKNHKSLKSLLDQFDPPRRPRPSPSPSARPTQTSPSSDDNSGCGWIIAAVIVLIIMVNACS